LRERKTILVVEDDTETLGLLRDALSDHWDVVATRGASEAVREWQRLRPAGIVLDLRLGGGQDGIDVFHEIRRRNGRPPPTLLVSGAEQALQAGKALRLPVLRKPFDLIAAVARLAGD
jgi:DNA-binding response OmpR family regulator